MVVVQTHASEHMHRVSMYGTLCVCVMCVCMCVWGVWTTHHRVHDLCIQFVDHHVFPADKTLIGISESVVNSSKMRKHLLVYGQECCCTVGT